MGRDAIRSSPDSTLPIPPDRLAVLERLPEGVEFSIILGILSDVPGPSATQLWTNRESHDPLVDRFRTSTYRTADRVLRKEAAALARLPSDLHSAERERVDALRSAWTSQVMGEVPGFRARPTRKLTDQSASSRKRSAGDLAEVEDLVGDPADCRPPLEDLPVALQRRVVDGREDAVDGALELLGGSGRPGALGGGQDAYGHEQ